MNSFVVLQFNPLVKVCTSFCFVWMKILAYTNTTKAQYSFMSFPHKSFVIILIVVKVAI